MAHRNSPSIILMNMSWLVLKLDTHSTTYSMPGRKILEIKPLRHAIGLDIVRFRYICRTLVTFSTALPHWARGPFPAGRWQPALPASAPVEQEARSTSYSYRH